MYKISYRDIYAQYFDINRQLLFDILTLETLKTKHYLKKLHDNTKWTWKTALLLNYFF